jgi:NAD-dependent deacetylase
LKKYPPIVILTGAGISAEAGIRTFRDSDGLWENHRIEDVATPDAFLKNPKLVQQFYNARRKQLLDPNLKPTLAHLALAELEKKWPGEFLIVTQNVDHLHEQAGSQKLIHMHGELQKVFCGFCTHKMKWTEDLSQDHTCPHCEFAGRLRPDIVWFGERPYYMDEIMESLSKCEIFISIGTSGRVYPAAGFVEQARRAQKIEINISQSDISSSFDENRIGPATIKVPEVVCEILNKIY